MSKIDLKKINNPNIERSDENHHFRVEVKSGHFKEGTSIGDANMDLMGHRTFVGLYAKESFEYGLLFNYFDPFPIPSLAIKSVRRNRYQQNKMLISGHLENPHLIARLDHKDYFRDKTFVDFRFGDFDGDGDPDLAYVTSQADGLIQSHIFYYEPILREDQSSMVIFELMNRFVRMHLIPHGEFHYSVIDRMKDAFSVVDRLAEGKRGSVEERAHDQVVTTLTDLSHRFVGQCVCHPRALREIAYYFDFLTKYEKRPEILSVVEWFNASVLSPQVYYPLLGRVASSETDDTRAAALVRLFSQVARRWAKSSEGVNRTVDLLLEIAPFLTIDQMRMLVYLYNETDQEERRTVSQFCKEFERIKGRPEEAYSELYKFLGGSDELSPDQLLKYVNLLDKRGSQARIHDIIAADKSIGPKGANLLAKKFKILRFGRYHPSVLQHMVDLIKNPFLDEDKPLILAMVAGYDHNDALYWGKFFKRDSRVRVIVLEIDTWENFKNLPWMVRREYGIPDVLMLTNHGQKHQIDLGRDEDDYVDYINLNFALRMKEAFHDFLGHKMPRLLSTHVVWVVFQKTG